MHNAHAMLAELCFKVLEIVSHSLAYRIIIEYGNYIFGLIFVGLFFL